MRAPQSRGGALLPLIILLGTAGGAAAGRLLHKAGKLVGDELQHAEPCEPLLPEEVRRPAVLLVHQGGKGVT